MGGWVEGIDVKISGRLEPTLGKDFKSTSGHIIKEKREDQKKKSKAANKLNQRLNSLY